MLAVPIEGCSNSGHEGCDKKSQRKTTATGRGLAAEDTVLVKEAVPSSYAVRERVVRLLVSVHTAIRRPAAQ